MKLRNKKTGKIMGMSMAGDIVWVGNHRYKSLADLNEEWEDYGPIEPLIKNEKVRKAVRAWAEANDIGQKNYYGNDVKFDFLEHRFKWIETSIEFNDIKGLEYLEDGWEYSIDELCGEEEE